jgi:DNA polymerase II small subunit
MEKKEIVSYLMEKDVLVSPELLEKLENVSLDQIKNLSDEELLVYGKDAEQLIGQNLEWKEIDKSKSILEKEGGEKDYTSYVQKKEVKSNSQVNVKFSYNLEPKKRKLKDFVDLFNARYASMEKLLSKRMEISNLTSISRLKNKKDRDNVSLIAMVSEKRTTKNGNLMIVVEDPTGTTNVLVNKNKPELFNEAKDIVLDEVIAVNGVSGDNIIFANTVLWPEVPLTKELKKIDEEVYAVFLSDLHIGSTNFLPKDFDKFLSWMNGEVGNDTQKAVASKIKYAFIVGDLVDGCGIYPGQDEELSIKDINEQYNECARLLKKIPGHVEIIVCPGNHDAMRIAEPQPPLYKDFAGQLYDLPNVTMVSNPAMINIHASENFSGFDVLMYHGYSFDYFVANVDSIRNKGGYDRGDLIMKFLLKRRHLAPTHTSTLYLPQNEDALVINDIPDIFVTGHIHKSIAANYRNVTLISGSCWQSKTDFQEKVGHNPEPSRVPIVNLKTRKVKILRFGGNE